MSFGILIIYIAKVLKMEHLLPYLLLVFSCICNGMKGVFAKKSNAYLTAVHNIYTYNFFMFVISFLITLIVSIPSLGLMSWQTVVMAVLYGAFLVFGQIFLIKAMGVGEVSVSMLFYSCGFLIPTFFSAFMYEDDRITLIPGIGIALILLSFAVTIEKTGRGNAKWFLFAIPAFLCNGCVGIIQKIFSKSPFVGEQSVFMLFAFLVGAIVTFIIMPKKGWTLPSKGFMKTVLGSGMTLGIVNTINVYISGVLPAVIVFPGVNGAGIIVSAIMARILLGEKISFRKKIGIAIGVFAICLIAM